MHGCIIAAAPCFYLLLRKARVTSVQFARKYLRTRANWAKRERCYLRVGVRCSVIACSRLRNSMPGTVTVDSDGVRKHAEVTIPR
jgi:hypothetical protein